MNQLMPNTRKADIAIYKDGRIYVHASLARSIDIADGDVLGIATEHGEYLVFGKKVPGRHSGVCRLTNRPRGTFRVCSRKLTMLLFSKLGYEGEVIRLAAGDITEIDGRKAAHLITRMPL